MLRRKHIAGNREGVAGAVATIFVLLIVLSFINIFIGSYVPSYMSTQEYSHMQEAYQEFSNYQLQAYTLQSGAWKYPMPSTIQLGSSGYAPFASPTPGTLAFQPGGFNATVSYSVALPPSNISHTYYFHISGSLSLYVQNRYYTPQTVIYEGGSIFLNQSGHVTVLKNPQFSLKNTSAGESLSTDLISLNGNPFSVSGSGSANLLSTYFSNQSFRVFQKNGLNVSISITSPEISGWVQMLNPYLVHLSNAPPTTKTSPPVAYYSLTVGGDTLSLKIFNITSLEFQTGTMSVAD